MAARSLSELVAPDWAEALGPVAGRITELGEFLRAEIAAGRSHLPAGRTSCGRSVSRWPTCGC